MNPNALARITAAGRVAIGAAFLAQPQVWMRPWIGRDAGRPGARLLARALGARDLVLGLGTLASSGSERRRWLTAAMVADATDMLATLAAGEDIPQRGRALVIGVAGGALALGAVAAYGPGRG